MLAIPLIERMTPHLSHRHLIQLLVSLSIASGAGAIVCGALGKQQATKFNLPIARWMAIVGILLGVLILLGLLGMTAIVKYYA
jgi:ABC-type sulfate transport system permease subunit